MTERRYYWHDRYGLTEEDWLIIRERGIPMVDQERQLYYERPDQDFTIRAQAQQRRHWRKVRQLTGRIL